MQKFIILAALVTVLAGCPKTPTPEKNPIGDIGCSIGTVVGFGLSAAIADQLKCENPLAINKDIHGVLVKLNVCKETVGVKSVGSSMCKLVATSMLENATEATIGEWKCEGGAVKEKAIAHIDSLCNLIP